MSTGAAEFGVKTYGAAGSQQAVPGSNVIAMRGGKKSRKQRKQNKGGNILSDMAVPASLIYANHVLGKKTYKKNGGKVSRKNRKSRHSRKINRR